MIIVLNLLTIFNIVKLSNVLYSHTYTNQGKSNQEWFDFIDFWCIACLFLLQFCKDYDLIKLKCSKEIPSNEIHIFQFSIKYYISQTRSIIHYIELLDKEVVEKRSYDLKWFIQEIQDTVQLGERIIDMPENEEGSEDLFQNNFGVPEKLKLENFSSWCWQNITLELSAFNHNP